VLPRGGVWAERVGREARARSLEPVTVPLVSTLSPADPAPRAAATASLGEGGYAWVAVTSGTGARVLTGLVPRRPAGVRVAAVGEATADVFRAAGWPVDLVPREANAQQLAQALAEADVDGRVLFPRADIAGDTLAVVLRHHGIDVDDVVAYRTVGTGTDRIVLDPPPDAVLVTSGSVAEQVAARLTPLDRSTRIACIGPRTAAEARAVGLPVHVIGRSRSIPALLDAIVADLERTPLV
jgi:uroporphyrinogen-III synthase